MEKIKHLINSEEYSLLLLKVKEVKKIEINSNLPSITILNYDVSRLTNSKKEVNDIIQLLAKEMEKISLFCVYKLTKFLPVIDEGEFPNLESQDSSETVEILAFDKNFLVGYIIEYFFIKYDNDNFEKYLKSIRIPQNKKYANELRDIYKQAIT